MLGARGGQTPPPRPPLMGSGLRNWIAAALLHRWSRHSEPPGTGQAELTGTHSASVAGPWGGPGHLGSPGLHMPLTLEDGAEWGAPPAGVWEVLFVRTSHVLGRQWATGGHLGVNK